MLPGLRAEERLNAIVDGGVAAGTVERDEQRSVMAALKADAKIKSARPAKVNGAALVAMGIGVVGPSAPPKEVLSDA